MDNSATLLRFKETLLLVLAGKEGIADRSRLRLFWKATTHPKVIQKHEICFPRYQASELRLTSGNITSAQRFPNLELGCLCLQLPKQPRWVSANAQHCLELVAWLSQPSLPMALAQPTHCWVPSPESLHMFLHPARLHFADSRFHK